MAKVDPHSGWEAVVNGGCGDEEFENILSILDFPMESLEGDGFVGDWDVSKSQYFGPIPSDVLIGPPMIAQTKVETGLPVMMHRQVSLIDATPEPKQPPYDFKEASALLQNKSTETLEQGVFQSQSPVSVLENNGSSVAGKSPLIKSHISKRTRSKRARPSGVNPWLLISPLLSSTSRNTCSSRRIREGRKKISSDMARNPHRAADYLDQRNAASSPPPAVAKRCAHCEVTRTPQWREGPMGPKTLCNACGVRYRSGRLYPEYRPAASPTFVPSLHSNSHKKVIEMRTKAKEQKVSKIKQSPISPEPEFVPVSGYFFDPV